jgi:ADP-heptose:LPS heptosyltransferase
MEKALMKEIKKILLFRDGRVGDILLMSGSIPLLNKMFPEASIDLLVSTGGGDILTQHEGLANIYLWSYRWPLHKRLQMLIRLRRNRYDLMITFEAGDRPTITSWLICGGYRFALRSKFKLLMHRTVPYVKTLHVSQNYLSLLHEAAFFLHKRKLLAEDQMQKVLETKNLPPRLVIASPEKEQARLDTRSYYQNRKPAPRERISSSIYRKSK